MAKERKTEKRSLARFVLPLYALLFAAALLLALDGRHIRFYLSGPRDLELPAGSAYSEPGCRAVSAGSLFGELGRDLPVTAEGEVDGQTPGVYTRTYTARWLLWEESADRRVYVVDRTPPVITLERREGYAPSWLDGYEEEGFRAEDNIDGDLSAQVERVYRGDSVDYSVSDTAGNRTTVTRQIPYSVGRPRIRPVGGERLQLPASFNFIDPGWTAFDDMGNDLWGYVKAEGAVDPTRPGVYELRYSAENRAGDVVSVTRTVEIVPASLPESVIPEEKTIYLSFDDGPGPHTARLLDVLREYGVKATFFVTCREPDHLDMVGRAFREGHSIGVHSASHNYYAIYASEDAFYEDFKACEEMIYAQTGQYTKLFRFPGGSSNTVSSFNPGIMTRLTKSMHDMGYQYYDWNVDSDDAGNTHWSGGVLRNVENGCEGKDFCLVLQHDVKDYSVAAVRQLIEWGLANGYRFAPLDMTSPPAHHPLAN